MPFSAVISLIKLCSVQRYDSIRCVRASTAVFLVVLTGRLSKYFASRNAASAKVRFDMPTFVFFSGTVKMAYCVTSLPVPAVVGISITGRCLASPFSKRNSDFSSGFAARNAMALALSIGEPPPIPITKSAFSLTAIFPALTTVSNIGFSSISSKIQ